VPYEEVLQAVRREVGAHLKSLFLVKFVLQNAGYRELQLPGLKLTQEDISHCMFDLDLFFELAELPEGLKGRILYSTDLFEAETVNHIGSQFQLILENAASNPEITLREIERVLADRDVLREHSRRDRRQQAMLRRFRAVRPTAVNLSQIATE
jgi:non-ribosomal peptide synthetase component F